MVMAGARKRKIQGARENSGCRVAYPLLITFNGFLSSQMDPLSAHRKTAITTYPVRLLKNPLISFLKSIHMMGAPV